MLHDFGNVNWYRT